LIHEQVTGPSVTYLKETISENILVGSTPFSNSELVWNFSDCFEVETRA